MKKRRLFVREIVLILISVILCFLILCSCTNDTLSKPQTDAQTDAQTDTQAETKAETDTETETQPNEEDWEGKVIRYPVLDNHHKDPCSDYYASGLLYPFRSNTVDSSLEGASQKFVLNNKVYSAAYEKSRVYADTDSDFLKRGNYDKYVVKGKALFEGFKDTGFIKKVYIYADEVEVSEKIVTDFSEKGLRSVSESLLTDLYGESILRHLNGYYQFEYAKFMEYSKSELNRYAVSYRAYLNGIPTDDIIYITFSPSGALKGISAQNYLQYLNVDEASLKPIEQLEKAIRDELTKFEYSRIELRNNELPCYYTMNSEGEIFYVTEWETFKHLTEDTGVTIIEIMAIKAESALHKESAG